MSYIQNLFFYRSETQEKIVKLQNENEQALQQLEDAELKASTALKQAGAVEVQLVETQVSAYIP